MGPRHLLFAALLALFRLTIRSVAPPPAMEKMMRWFPIAYLIFVAAVVVWVLVGVAYGIAPACVAGTEWARTTCFMLPLWRFFA